MLTGSGEEDRDKDDYVMRWWRKDATSASTGSGEEDRDEDDYVRWWWQKDATLASTGGGEENRDDHNNDPCARRWRR
jgi:hypothetical protein